MPTLTVNGRRVTMDSDATLLDAARAAGVEVPTLCQFDGLEPWGGCRLCVVDMSQANWDDDWFKVVTACNHPVEEGMTVVTDSERIIETRRVVLDLLLARCPDTPLIQQLALEFGIERTSYTPNPEPDDCILCGLCTRVCDHIGVSGLHPLWSLHAGLRPHRGVRHLFDQPRVGARDRAALQRATAGLHRLSGLCRDLPHRLYSL
jgi:heterodisulfide reductase subunit A